MGLIHFKKTIEILVEYKDLSTFLIFSAVPFFYITGHIIMGLDYSIMSRIGRRINRLNRRWNNKITRLLSTIVLGYRVLGVKQKLWKEEYGDYLEECVKLDKNGEYTKAEYWELISDLNKGFVVIFFISIIIGLCYNDWQIIIFSLILLFICWDRARLFATFHINAVINRINSKKDKDTS